MEAGQRRVLKTAEAHAVGGLEVGEDGLLDAAVGALEVRKLDHRHPGVVRSALGRESAHETFSSVAPPSGLRAREHGQR